jgi:hypothetical protein
MVEGKPKGLAAPAARGFATRKRETAERKKCRSLWCHEMVSVNGSARSKETCTPSESCADHDLARDTGWDQITLQFPNTLRSQHNDAFPLPFSVSPSTAKKVLSLEFGFRKYA